MSILSKIFSKGASNLVDSVGSVIDELHTSKEEKAELKNKFTDLLQTHEAKVQRELTKRHQIDMVSNNKLSKLIRPLTLIYMTSFLTGIVVIDSIDKINFAVDEVWIKLLTTLLVVIFSFYFGGRELQKWLINKKL